MFSDLRLFEAGNSTWLYTILNNLVKVSKVGVMCEVTVRDSRISG
jgi:hypothetical protein